MPDAKTGISTISIIQKGIIELSRISLAFQADLLAVINAIELNELKEIKSKMSQEPRHGNWKMVNTKKLLAACENHCGLKTKRLNSELVTWV